MAIEIKNLVSGFGDILDTRRERIGRLDIGQKKVKVQAEVRNGEQLGKRNEVSHARSTGEMSD